jgi:hypothetical protein
MNQTLGTREKYKDDYPNSDFHVNDSNFVKANPRKD